VTRLFGIDHEKARARAIHRASFIVSRFVQAIHVGGCGFCTGLGEHVPAGHREVLPRSRDRIRAPSCWRSARRLQRHRALFLCRNRETAELKASRAFSNAELDAPVRENMRVASTPAVRPDGCSSGSPGGYRGRGECSSLVRGTAEKNLGRRGMGNSSRKWCSTSQASRIQACRQVTTWSRA